MREMLKGRVKGEEAIRKRSLLKDIKSEREGGRVAVS